MEQVGGNRFLPPESGDAMGLVGVGPDLSLEVLLYAYRRGIFPWPSPPHPWLGWFSPDPRGVLEFDDLHISTSTWRTIKRRLSKGSMEINSRRPWRICYDENFRLVQEACRRVPRPGQSDSWITVEMLDAYEDFFLHGYAHCVEVWEENELVGGIYGVDVGGVFSAESMFHLRSDASKVALYFLVQWLHLHKRTWMDVQSLNPVTAKLGAKDIPRKDFLLRLNQKNQPLTTEHIPNALGELTRLHHRRE